MLFLANALMQSPMRAMLGCFALGAATLVLSPIGLLSGAAIALVVLAAGLHAGLRAFAASAAGGLLLSVVLATTDSWLLAIVEFWLPALVFAVLLAKTRSLSQMLQSVTLLVLIGVTIVYAWLDSPAHAWLEMLRVMVQELGDNVLDVKAEALLLEQMPKVLTMLVAMGLWVVWISMILIARWWQARLYQTVDLADEFQRVQLGNAFAVALGLAFAVTLFMPEFSWLQDVLGVLLVAFMVQGLALLHFWAKAKQVHKGWLIAIYVLLAVLPNMMVMVASLGWMENWLNWRGKIASEHA